MDNKRVIIISPRGFCAGVDRAIDIVELSLEVYGAPIYVKHEIVHNVHVVKRLQEKGAIFTDDIGTIPVGAHVVFSAHGSPPEHYRMARERSLHIIDATCPLVSKVHLEVQRYARLGYAIIMVGHRGHVEPVGTLGNAGGVETHLIESVQEAQKLTLSSDSKIAVVTQTTLSLDETKDIVRVLADRFPQAEFPKKEDICYATTNRQRAVKSVLSLIDCLLVVGSRSSSNSNRLAEVGTRAGIESYLIEDVSAIDPAWLTNTKSIGVTSGASVPDDLVQGVASYLEKLGFSVETAESDIYEDVYFALPPAFVKEVKAIKPDADIIHKHAIKIGRSMRV